MREVGRGDGSCLEVVYFGTRGFAGTAIFGAFAQNLNFNHQPHGEAVAARQGTGGGGRACVCVRGGWSALHRLLPAPHQHSLPSPPVGVKSVNVGTQGMCPCRRLRCCGWRDVRTVHYSASFCSPGPRPHPVTCANACAHPPPGVCVQVCKTAPRHALTAARRRHADFREDPDGQDHHPRR